MTKSFNSPEEQARFRAVRDSAVKERADSAAKAVSDWQNAEAERDRNTVRLRAQRLAAEEAVRLAAPPPAPLKPRVRTLRPGQSPNTRRSITS